MLHKTLSTKKKRQKCKRESVKDNLAHQSHIRLVQKHHFCVCVFGWGCNYTAPAWQLKNYYFDSIYCVNSATHHPCEENVGNA